MAEAGAARRRGDGQALAVLDTFVAGLGARATQPALARLRAGAPLDLRRGGAAVPGCSAGLRGTVEIWTAEGDPLGLLSPEDAQAFDRLTVSGGRPVSARVSAVVPAFQRPRVQVRIAFAMPEEACGAAG